MGGPKHVADGRPALGAIEAGPSGDEEEREGDDIDDADGMRAMEAFHEAHAKGDHMGMWHAIRSAVDIAKSSPEPKEQSDADDDATGEAED